MRPLILQIVVFIPLKLTNSSSRWKRKHKRKTTTKQAASHEEKEREKWNGTNAQRENTSSQFSKFISSTHVKVVFDE